MTKVGSTRKAYLSRHHNIGKGINFEDGAYEILSKDESDNLNYLPGGQGVCAFTIKKLADHGLCASDFRNILGANHGS